MSGETVKVAKNRYTNLRAKNPRCGKRNTMSKTKHQRMKNDKRYQDGNTRW